MFEGRQPAAYLGMTVSMTWMMPLLAGTSGFTINALLIFSVVPLTAS